MGPPETHQREWLLDIDFRKRETFAYACEAYSRILEAGSTLGPTRPRSAPPSYRWEPAPRPGAEGSKRSATADLREALIGPQKRVQVGGVVQVERRVRELHDPPARCRVARP